MFSFERLIICLSVQVILPFSIFVMISLFAAFRDKSWFCSFENPCISFSAVRYSLLFCSCSKLFICLSSLLQQMITNKPINTCINCHFFMMQIL